MFIKTVKISRKGQITLPRQIREALGSKVVKLVLKGRTVVIEPVEDLAGSLKKYAKPISIEEAKEKAWTEAVREKFGGD